MTNSLLGAMTSASISNSSNNGALEVVRNLFVLFGLSVEAAYSKTEYFGPFIYYPQRPADLTLNGRIDARSAMNFRRAIDAHPEIDRLFLNSGGGAVQTALNIADDVHRSDISTFIEGHSKCFSGCAFIFSPFGPTVSNEISAPTLTVQSVTKLQLFSNYSSISPFNYG